MTGEVNAPPPPAAPAQNLWAAGGAGWWVQVFLGPFLMVSALLGGGAPPPSYLLVYLALLPVLWGWHLGVVARFLGPAPLTKARRGGDDAQALTLLSRWWGQPCDRRLAHWEDIRSLGWYLLVFLPLVGGYLALLGVLGHRVRARVSLGLSREQALAQVFWTGLLGLLGLGAAQWVFLGGFAGFSALCEASPATCGLR